MLNQGISYYIDLQAVDKIIENMNLQWVENKAGGEEQPFNDISLLIKEYNAENISAIYLFRQGKVNPEYAVLSNENKDRFLGELAGLAISGWRKR